MLQSNVFIGGETKAFNVLCTICCLGTESNVYKTRELKIKRSLKTEKLAVSNPFD